MKGSFIRNSLCLLLSALIIAGGILSGSICSSGYDDPGWESFAEAYHFSNGILSGTASQAGGFMLTAKIGSTETDMKSIGMLTDMKIQTA